MPRSPRPCLCDKTERCRLCWLYHNDPRYHALWSGQPVSTLPRPPCVHLGDATGNRRLCDSCNGKVELKLFECRHPRHGPEVTMRDCQTCPDHLSPDPAGPANLESSPADPG